MELVYLWVEKYKNIKNQGFNFSPRFECEFDEDTKELTITGNKDYVNIFPNNINITAIVGKNGSGKSGLLEYIIRNIYYYYYKSEKMEQSNYENFMLFYDKHSNQISIIWNIYKCITIKNYTNIKIEKNKIEPRWKPPKTMPFKLEENESFDSNYYEKTIHIFKNNSYIFHYDYSFSRFYIEDKTIGSIRKVTEIEQLYSGELSSILCLPNKNNINTDTFDSNNDKFTIIKTLVSNNKNIDFKSNYFKPNIATLKISHSIDTEKSNFEILYKLVNEYIEDKIFKPNDIYLSNDKIGKDIKKAKDLEKVKAEKYLKILEKHKSQLDKLFRIENITAGYNNPIRFIFKIQIKELNNNNIELLTEVPKNLFEIDLIEGDKTFGKTYEELSNGEKSILRIIYSIENIVYSTKKQVFYILLEEVEKDLHPDWQKELLNYLIKVFKNKKPNFHFIITSHSPFLLSDLPRKNVIFLDKIDEKTEKKYPKLDIKDLKDGNCINVSEHIKLKTFGANIHTLLSDGFFMSDGLMGEFAKNKIEEIKKFYELVKFLQPKNKKYKRILKILYLFKIKKFNHIQSIIGEPFLQTIIKNYLDELKQIFDNETYKKNKMKEFLDQFEPEELQKYLDEKNAKA